MDKSAFVSYIACISCRWYFSFSYVLIYCSSSFFFSSCRFLMHFQVVIHLLIRMCSCLILPWYSSNYSLSIHILNIVFLISSSIGLYLAAHAWYNTLLHQFLNPTPPCVLLFCLSFLPDLVAPEFLPGAFVTAKWTKYPIRLSRQVFSVGLEYFNAVRISIMEIEKVE